MEVLCPQPPAPERYRYTAASCFCGSVAVGQAAVFEEITRKAKSPVHRLTFCSVAPLCSLAARRFDLASSLGPSLRAGRSSQRFCSAPGRCSLGRQRSGLLLRFGCRGSPCRRATKRCSRRRASRRIRILCYRAVVRSRGDRICAAERHRYTSPKGRELLRKPSASCHFDKQVLARRRSVGDGLPQEPAWVLGGLGRFLSRLARVTRRCRRQRARRSCLVRA